jgi:copper chaperone CopZ
MKLIIKYFYLMLILCCTMTLHAQDNQGANIDTVTLQVAGVCEDCKRRIETASYDVPGVKKATWDIESEILTAIINPKKASRQKIADAVALAGYRSELAQADPKAYQKLPACCQYDSGIDKH